MTTHWWFPLEKGDEGMKIHDGNLVLATTVFS